MWLIAGLGNPGKSYQANRHNVGFMAVDTIAHRHRFSGFSKKQGAEISEGQIENEKLLLVKPLSFMNLSGTPVGELARYYKIPLEQVIVIHDELDIVPGKLRVKRGGGNGGHNGLKSLDAHLGQDYTRIRIGIGHPGDRDMVSGYVLHDFSKEDMQQVMPVLDAVSTHIGELLAGDEAGFMNKVALATQPPKPPKPPKPTTNEEKNGI